MEMNCLKGLSQGDIIVASTKTSIDQLKSMESDHRVCPYIVARKLNNTLLCYAGTSNSCKEIWYSCQLLRSNYKVWKDGKIN